MTNIEKLKRLGILGDVRNRQGASDENDTTFDEKINRKSNHQLISDYCAWNLGYSSWWNSLKHNFDELEGMDNE